MPDHEERIFKRNGGGIIKANKYIIGVDIGGTHIRMGTVSPELTLHKEAIFETAMISGMNAGKRLLNILDQYITNLTMQIKAISIGFPSLLSKDREVIVSTPNIKGLDNLSVQAQYEKKLNVPIFIEKDTCMLMHYDLHKFNITQGIVVGFYVGTGLGNIILIDGKVITGKDGVAGELGHIPVLFKYDECSCGLQGCAELYSAGKGLERIHNQNFANTSISKIFTKHNNSREIRLFIENLAKIIVAEIHILNPDHIVLGGGVLSMNDFPYEQLVDYIHHFTRKPLPEETLHIIRSDYSNPYNGVIGAALFARKEISERDLHVSTR